MYAFVVADGFVFWTGAWGSQGKLGVNGRSALFRADLDGTHVRILARNLFYPFPLVVARGRVYWVDESAIGAVDLTGARVDHRLVAPSQEYGGGVADGLASDGKYLYFTQCMNGAIGRVGLDGRGLDPRFVVVSGRSCPEDLTYADGDLYFSNGGDSIGRVTLRSRRVEPNWLRVSADGVVADAGNVYWEVGGASGGVVGRARSDGKIVSWRYFRIPQGEQIAIGPA
jgi:hypothetical protein